MLEDLKKAVKTYDKIAGIYSKYSEEKLMQYQLVKFENFLKGKKILDAGCGSGRDSKYFYDDGYDVTGVDLSEELLKIAKKNSKAKFKVMDFTDLKFKDKTFHGVWCMSSLSDLPQKESIKALKEFYRVLKENGFLYLAAREGKGKRTMKKEKYNAERHYHFYDQKKLNNDLEKAGFEILFSDINNSNGANWIEIFAKKLQE